MDPKVCNGVFPPKFRSVSPSSVRRRLSNESNHPTFSSPTAKSIPGRGVGGGGEGDDDHDAARTRMGRRVLTCVVVVAVLVFLRNHVNVAVSVQIGSGVRGGDGAAAGREGAVEDLEVPSDSERQYYLETIVTTPERLKLLPLGDGSAETETGKNLSQQHRAPTNVDLSCVLKSAVLAQHAVEPVITASYPGSGAKMTWILTEAITGLVTGDEYNHNGATNIVSIKSHYPHAKGRNFAGSAQVRRAVLLLRNPIYAIPSLCSLLYESQMNLPANSRRAHLEIWLNWREANYKAELDAWKEHTQHWMMRYEKHDRLVISYERLTDKSLGTLEATRLTEFLSGSRGVDTRPVEEIPCVWWKVIGVGGEEQWGRRRLQEVEVLPPPASGQEIVARIRESENTKATEAKTSEEAVEAKVKEMEADLKASQTTKDLVSWQLQEELTKKSGQVMHSSSKRGGPIYLHPYSEVELQMAIDTFKELLDEFKDEEIFRSTLGGYINDVNQRIEVLHKESKDMMAHLVAPVEHGAPLSDHKPDTSPP